ncbi:MAG: TrkH family potassium uptake protein [Arenicella sp.]
MDFKTITRILGVLLVLFSATHLPPVLVSWIYQDGNAFSFIAIFIGTLLMGLLFWLPGKSHHHELRYRDGFVVVVLFWTVLGLFGAFPFYLSAQASLSVTDAFFESMSGLTTTGATVIPNLEEMPKSILYYRQQLQWLGGMGIVVLAVAIMPMLGVGGMQLYRAETPGPMKDSKLKPRITETAKALWYLYFGLTVICAIAYWLAGMDAFDAICHSFSTIAIGGFSTHDQSIGFFNSSLIETVAIVFMLLASANFSLHFLAFKSRSLLRYIRDSEYIAFLTILLISTIIICLLLITSKVFPSAIEGFQQGIFHVVSVATTTGFTSSGFAWWPGVLPLLLIVGSFVGGCAGSTAGGIKVMRIQLLYKQGKREIVRLVHPNALLSIKLGNHVINENVISGVWAFFSLYILSFVMISLALCAVGTDWVTAFSAAAACLNNLGPGLGEVAENYTALSNSAKWILTFAMLLGRLELFTLLVLFTTTFWRN